MLEDEYERDRRRLPRHLRRRPEPEREFSFELRPAVRTDMPDVLGLAAHGHVSPSRSITRRYRLEQADEAYAALNRGDIVGRAVITTIRLDR